MVGILRFLFLKGWSCNSRAGRIEVRTVIKIAVVMILVLCSGLMAGAQELDSLQQRALSVKLDEYFAAIEKEGTDVQKEECDFLIGTASDSLMRQFIALKAYDHYLNSPVMGSEAVAIHVLDKWFIPGKVRMKNDFDLINARVYADFNRQSLVGMKAPELSMESSDGKNVTLFGAASPQKRFSVLYFYDTDCSKCKVESILLRNVLEDNDFPIDLYAVYSGDDRKSWEEYVSTRLNVEASKVHVVNLWDPELDSDFQRKYGVLQTPRMYLVRPDGVIIGRGLDTEALYMMLRGIFTDVNLNYGSDESAGLFDGILYSEEDTSGPSSDRVCSLVEYISDSTLPKGDTLMFRQLSGDLLYYLSTRSGEGIKDGLKFLLEKNIYGQPAAWNSQDDSLKVIGFADIMDDLLSKSEVGSVVPDLKVPAELLGKGKEKSGAYNMRKLRADRNIILFYTEGCNICQAEKSQIRELLAHDRKTKALFINIDEILASNPSLADTLFDSFDLSSLPYIIITDRKGVVLRRYLSYR